MRHLSFPTDEIVGTLDWLGSWNDDKGPQERYRRRHRITGGIISVCQRPLRSAR
jgi:hypothetical protein